MEIIKIARNANKIAHINYYKKIILIIMDNVI
jgi:hypothetical protein